MSPNGSPALQTKNVEAVARPLRLRHAVIEASWHTAPPPERRTRYLDLTVGRVEVVSSAAHLRRKSAEGFSPEFQVALPFRGIFVWHVGRDEVVGDANQILFVAGGESYRISHPLPDGYEELIITPSPEVLSEIASTDVSSLTSHPLFHHRRRRADPHLQALRARFLCWLTAGAEHDDLAAGEEILRVLRALVSVDEPRNQPSPSTRRLIRRTKEFLEAHLVRSIRLADVGAAVGASAPYLTHAFTRFEGVSLHQYLTHLRLARALSELAHTDDLTALALELGFSSHSHFSAAFHRAYGLTPSRFRQLSRTGRSRSAVSQSRAPTRSTRCCSII